MTYIYKLRHQPSVNAVLQEMYNKLVGSFGVTLVGNRLTLRWNKCEQIVDVHMIIEHVTTPNEAAASVHRAERIAALIEKYEREAPDLADELRSIEAEESMQ